MAKINEYYKKKEMMDQLARELQALELDSSLRKELEFEESVRALMRDSGKTSRDLLSVLQAIDPALKARSSEVVASVASEGRKPRAMKVYVNPNSGERVETRGGNHKTLNAWRDQYGKDAVNSWLQA